MRLIFFFFSIHYVVYLLGMFLLCFGKAPETSVKVFAAGEGGYTCIKIPYLLRTPSNILIAFAEGRGKIGKSSCDDFSGTDLVYKRSEDDGKTWSSLAVLFTNSSDTEINVIGNAAPVVDRFKNKGRIWVPFCRNNEEVFITYSDDHGLSWSTPTYHPHLVQPIWKWVGLGPPSGLQLTSGRMLIPSYHTNGWKGDGSASRGHTIISDDFGLTWRIGAADYGRPYLVNENQAVELKNGSLLFNARTLFNHRVQLVSEDGGLTFDEPYEVDGLVEPLEGCEGSLIRDPVTDSLYFSDPFTHHLVRTNLTIFVSQDDGLRWQQLRRVDRGSVAYSSLSVFPSPYVLDHSESYDSTMKSVFVVDNKPLVPRTSVNSAFEFESESIDKEPVTVRTTIELAVADSETVVGGAEGVRRGLEVLYERSDKVSLVFEPQEIVYWKVHSFQ